MERVDVPGLFWVREFQTRRSTCGERQAEEGEKERERDGERQRWTETEEEIQRENQR